MTDRKKKGIGFMISGAAFLAVGGLFTFADLTPDWVAAAIALVGMVAQFFGFTTVFPDTEA